MIEVDATHLFILIPSIFIAGLTIGLFGAGGSILMVPILVYILKIEIKVAIGMTLLIQTFTAATAALRFGYKGELMWRLALQCSSVGIIFAFMGGMMSSMIAKEVLMIAFGVIVILAALAMFWNRDIVQADKCKTGIPLRKTLTSGAGVGFITGLLGVGGGFLLVPCINLFCSIELKRAIGTALLIIAMNSLAGFVGLSNTINMPWDLLTIIVPLSVVGSLVGQLANERISIRRLKTAMPVILLVIGTGTIIDFVYKWMTTS